MTRLFLKIFSTPLPLFCVAGLGLICIGIYPAVAQAEQSSAPDRSGASLSGTASLPVVAQKATLDFELREVGGGLGYEWGKGTLHFGGKDHPFEIGGGGIASLGYVAIKGTGTVKNLTRLDQFDGTYWTVKADAAAGSGAGAAVLENQYGVQISLVMQVKGAHVGASIMRLRFRLLDDGTEKLAILQ